jgi:ABC-type multidrug transport system fused ATPase/permease subunit
MASCLRANLVLPEGIELSTFPLASATRETQRKRAEKADLLNGTLDIPEAASKAQHDSVALVDVLARYEVLGAIPGAILGALALGFIIAVALRPRCTQHVELTGKVEEAADRVDGKQSLKAAAEVTLIAVVAGTILIPPVLAGPCHDHGDGGHEPAAAATGIAPRKLPDGSVLVPKPSQRLLEVRTQPAVQFRQATFIDTSIANVKRVLIEALVVVAIVLFAFLHNWQTTVISLIAIPLSVLTTVIVFQSMGLSINTMTLGGSAAALDEMLAANTFKAKREQLMFQGLCVELRVAGCRGGYDAAPQD